MYYDFFRNGFNPRGLFDSIKYKRDFRREHPDYFDPDGILVFCGPQGSGKTLSAVNYVYQLACNYPNVKIVTNVELHDFPEGVEIFPYTGFECLSKYNNGYKGVIFLIDEIQIDFNSLDSKNIDPSVITEISQQRKQRKHIVGTSQVFMRIAKPFREQFKYAVMCSCPWGLVQNNVLVDGATAQEDGNGHLDCRSIKRFLWFHTPEMYKRYDTYAKVLKTDKKGGLQDGLRYRNRPVR